MQKFTDVMANHLMELRKDASDHAKFKVLEPLLWLSRMPHRAPRNAVLKAGVLSFLQEVAGIHVPELYQSDYRLIYRSKGDAINCLGNLFESMDEEEWSEFAFPELADSLNSTVVDEDLPLILRSQAADAVTRYRNASQKHGGWSPRLDESPVISSEATMADIAMQGIQEPNTEDGTSRYRSRNFDPKRKAQPSIWLSIPSPRPLASSHSDSDSSPISKL